VYEIVFGLIVIAIVVSVWRAVVHVKSVRSDPGFEGWFGSGGDSGGGDYGGDGGGGGGGD
jgi:hypothetical protein